MKKTLFTIITIALIIGAAYYFYRATIQTQSERETVYQLSYSLRDLGFYTGPNISSYDSELQQAIKDFQGKFNLEVTGVADATTINKITIEYAKYRDAQLIRRCPERWVKIAQKDWSVGDPGPDQFYVLDGGSMALFLFDQIWVKNNCTLILEEE